MMKIVKQFLLLFSCIMIAACNNDDAIALQTPESKDVVSLVYEGKEFEFKNLHYGKYTNENRELIGFFVEGEIVIDDQHKNRILLYFKTDFEHIVEFAGIEFTPFKPGSQYPYNVYAYVYQYIMSEHGSPFIIDLKMENGRITGSFEGYVHRSANPADLNRTDSFYLSTGKVHLSSGKIDIEAKTTND